MTDARLLTDRARPAVRLELSAARNAAAFEPILGPPRSSLDSA